MNEHGNAPIDDTLARLRYIEVPAIDPARETALLRAFDAHWARPRGNTSLRFWSTAAALATIVAGLNWLVVSNTPHIRPVASEPAFTMAGFVPWPGADAWPPFESGSLVRIDLPVSALSALGLPAPFTAVSIVQADIVIGQDGFARAVRVVQ